MLTIVNGDTQLFGRSCGEDVNGVGHRRTREELGFQLVSLRPFYFGDVQPAFRQGVRQHHTRTAGMGYNGEVLAFEFGQGEDTTYGGQLLARETANDTCLAEQGLYR